MSLSTNIVIIYVIGFLIQFVYTRYRLQRNADGTFSWDAFDILYALQISTGSWISLLVQLVMNIYCWWIDFD